MIAALHLLPAEIILAIAKFLDYESEINALSHVNHRLHQLLIPYLYKLDFSNNGRSSQALIWATKHGIESTARKAINVGALPVLYIWLSLPATDTTA
jgi:hypothetical protein